MLIVAILKMPPQAGGRAAKTCDNAAFVAMPTLLSAHLTLI
jgi:hypothetical protein